MARSWTKKFASLCSFLVHWFSSPILATSPTEVINLMLSTTGEKAFFFHFYSKSKKILYCCCCCCYCFFLLKVLSFNYCSSFFFFFSFILIQLGKNVAFFFLLWKNCNNWWQKTQKSVIYQQMKALMYFCRTMNDDSYRQVVIFCPNTFGQLLVTGVVRSFHHCSLF